ncbi:MAG: RNA pseudouridine synthase [Candidatus Peregrinibacteria bacterium GW2011_GWE2_39_6]|nr:MAG: RNA pseudouridine synthase [Candidatus Peregrinibacteria bacterium GW2011_GWF2_39_17]KKR25822.1 MAG: RNA pseudouridine synthase [Candidatus Peregrinibacteria bacterium GW2011_GWE2_39_6]
MKFKNEIKIQKLLTEDQNKRLDIWLTENYPEKSRSFWQKKIKSGEILVNKKESSPHHHLRIDDRISIKLKPETSVLQGQNIPLEIVFENTHYAIINKSAGLVIHPGSGNKENTLVHALLHRYKNLSSTGGSERPGIVHRLDKETSGLLVIAKTDEAHRFLAAQFEAKTIIKEYLALADGLITPANGSIEAPLIRNIKQRKKITISTQSKGRYALTHYQVQATFSAPLPCSLLKINLATGRTHQIRVHLQAIGHPILGDSVYGKQTTNNICLENGLKRQFLHSAKLSFIAPITKKQVTYEAKLPLDLKHFLSLCIC